MNNPTVRAEAAQADPISHEMKLVAVGIFAEHLAVTTTDAHVALENVAGQIAEAVWPGWEHADIRRRFHGMCFNDVVIEAGQ